QLRKTSYTIIHLTTLILPAWTRTLERLGLALRIMPRDVATRWNSTYNMLVFALAYCQAIDDIAGEHSLGLRNFELKEGEWEIAEQLCDILRDATLFFSRSTPNLAMVIPAMDHIDQTLATQSIDSIRKKPENYSEL
ncbi:hypothetical protein PLICRDRAFT_119827, partial [Plicaturopsis crispa FD-325 SS-3]